MREEILVNVTPQETRVAIVENGVLQELWIERARARGIVGNIYKGRVVRVLPGMQAAFVDIGLDRTAFLHAQDVRPAPEPEPGPEVSSNGNGASPIATLLEEGQEILVQVVKDALGTKGARLTMEITLPARTLVHLPLGHQVGVSLKIPGEEERLRLRGLVQAMMQEFPDESGGGFIVRTLAEDATEQEVRADIQYLRRLWSGCEERMRDMAAPCVMHEDLPLAIRALRDLTTENIERIRIDSRETFGRAVEFAREFSPELADRIEHYPGERPIFDLYSVEDEIQKALERRVPLKSGGYLVIDETEALTTIDVNTGGYVGKRNLEDTLFKTNLEAAQSIARQIRLRNLGGMIIIDFIDMQEEEHARQVRRALERALGRDQGQVYFAGTSSLGLVELTRKRTRESLGHVLCESCPACQGRGMLKTPETVCYEIFREILREARQFDASAYTVIASQQVCDLLTEDEAGGLLGLQEFIQRPIHLKVDTGYTQEQYDVVLM